MPWDFKTYQRRQQTAFGVNGGDSPLIAALRQEAGAKAGTTPF